MRTRVWAALLATVVACAALAGCTQPSSGSGAAVLFPGGPDDAWGASAEALRAELARDGHPIEVRFAGDDIPTQLRQLQEALAAAPAAIVVAPVDTTALAAELALHDDPEVTLISYERLVMDAPELDVVAGFDHREAGRLQARALLEALGVTDAAGPPQAGLAVELLAGSSDDPAARELHAGLLEVLRPFLATGVLVVPSERVAFEQAAILRGSPETAAARVRELGEEGVELAAVLAASDAMTAAAAEVLREQGARIAPPSDVTPPEPTGLPEPTSSPSPDQSAQPDQPAQPASPEQPERVVVLIGSGASLSGVEAVRDGTRTATVYRDPQRLARAVANMVREILRGSAPTVTRGAVSDNGAAEIPTRLVEPQLVATEEKARALLP